MIATSNNNENKPLKRNESLQCLSHDHHYGLLLCWKIRTGLKKTDHERIKRYTDYFYKEHLLPHFKIEEKYIFPLLGEESELVQQAIKDHLKLKALFENKTNVLQSLIQIEVELEKHIRMEERVLFKELQRLVPESKLAEALQSHDEKKDDTWEDKFWEAK